MSPPSKRRRIADALEVRWTPALAARTGRRIGEAIARRRRRRRAVVAGLALLSLGGVSFAFVQGPKLLRRRQPAVAAARSASSGTPPTPAEAPPPSPADALPAAVPAQDSPRATTLTLPKQATHRRSAAAAPSPSVSSLFAAADAARLAGRPADAVAPLTAILDRFPGDRRAGLAAFQLGRVLADDLGDRAAAARAFARARELDPTGPFAGAAAARASEAQGNAHAGTSP
jgi:hypothetical protein